MPLLHRRRRSRSLQLYTVLTCPFNGHQVGPCRGLCTPIVGVGHCGRVAPHAMMGRTQLAILAERGSSASHPA